MYCDQCDYEGPGVRQYGSEDDKEYLCRYCALVTCDINTTLSSMFRELESVLTAKVVEIIGKIEEGSKH